MCGSYIKHNFLILFALYDFRFLSDEFEYKVPGAALGAGYSDMMVIEETVEMEIETDPQTLEFNNEEVSLQYLLDFMLLLATIPIQHRGRLPIMKGKFY